MHPTLVRAAANSGSGVLRSGARRDPELYVLAAVTAGMCGVAGYFIGAKPTSSTSEEKSIRISKDSSSWQTGSEAKYQYHPGGDTRNPPKDAPSALHSVVVPNVNLPRELHEKYNKLGREGY